MTSAEASESKLAKKLTNVQYVRAHSKHKPAEFANESSPELQNLQRVRLPKNPMPLPFLFADCHILAKAQGHL